MKLPSGDGDAAYQFVIKIAARVLVFIKDYQAQVLRRIVYQYVACWIYSPPSGDVHRRYWKDFYPGYSL